MTSELKFHVPVTGFLLPGRNDGFGGVLPSLVDILENLVELLPDLVEVLAGLAELPAGLAERDLNNPRPEA